MSSYERILEESRRRIEPEQFLPIRKIGEFSLRDMVWMIQRIDNKKLKVPKVSSISDEKFRAYALGVMRRSGVYEAKKASIVFGRLDEETDALALPIVAACYDSPSLWHDHAFKCYMADIIEPSHGSFVPDGAANMFSGQVMRMNRLEKPVLGVQGVGGTDAILKDVGLIEKMSSDFPEVTIAVRSRHMSYYIENGNTIETPYE